jgi:hypothetical protein
LKYIERARVSIYIGIIGLGVYAERLLVINALLKVVTVRPILPPVEDEAPFEDI